LHRNIRVIQAKARGGRSGHGILTKRKSTRRTPLNRSRSSRSEPTHEPSSSRGRGRREAIIDRGKFLGKHARGEKGTIRGSATRRGPKREGIVRSAIYQRNPLKCQKTLTKGSSRGVNNRRRGREPNRSEGEGLAGLRHTWGERAPNGLWRKTGHWDRRGER